MTDHVQPMSHQAEEQDDPLKDAAVGARLRCESVFIGRHDAKPVPEGVTNWDYFDGSLLAVGVLDNGRFKVWGTAVSLGPGLALTAAHVLTEHAHRIATGHARALCMGVRSGGRLDLWRVCNITAPRTGDVVVLSLELGSEMRGDWHVRRLPLTTRPPIAGDTLSIVGFRFANDANATGSEPVALSGDLFAARGTVVELAYPEHDSVLMPYPTIEIACGSLGGMSGGAVFDDMGCVVGVISTGLSHEDGRGPTFAAWIMPALLLRPEVRWPAGLYPPDTTLGQLDNGLVTIVGREHLTFTDNSVTFSTWR